MTQKFLNIFEIPTGLQVRIGKVTQSFAASKYDCVLSAALAWRNEHYTKGVLPNGLVVKEFTKDNFSVSEQKKTDHSRCSIRSRKGRKVRQITAYHSQYTSREERLKDLRKKYEEWRLDHNRIASLYNKKQTQDFLALAQKELSSLTPVLAEKIKLNIDLWDKCVDEIDNVRPVITTIEANQANQAILPKKEFLMETQGENIVDLSHLFTFEYGSFQPATKLEPKGTDAEKGAIEICNEIVSLLQPKTLSRKPKVILSEDNMVESLKGFPRANKNTRGKVFAPFIVETEKKSSYLQLSIPSDINGLPLNPMNISFNLANYDELRHAITYLATANYIYRGYLQKQKIVQRNNDVQFDWKMPEDSKNFEFVSINTLLDTILLQLGRKSFNSPAKCIERLIEWRKQKVCRFIILPDYYAVQMGNWNFVVPTNEDKNLVHLCLAIMASKVESALEEGYINRTLQRANKGQRSTEALQQKYSNVDPKQIERFKQLQAQLYREHRQHYPMVERNEIKTPRPGDVFLAKCEHCESVPNRMITRTGDNWKCVIECPNGCDTPVTMVCDHEAELHQAVINWQRQNIYSFSLPQQYMWNLHAHFRRRELGSYVYAVRDYLKDNVEYNALTRVLPKDVVKDRAGKGYARNISMNLLWAEFFVEAHELHLRTKEEDSYRNRAW